METIFDRIGGTPGVQKLVGDFYHRVLADPLLSPFFAYTSIEKLKTMQVAFFTIAMGGPVPEMSISIYEAHKNRGILRKHLTRFVEHLMATLEQHGFSEEDAHRVYERIATYADEILGDASVDG